MSTMTSTAPTIGTRSPWGEIDSAHTLIDGIVTVGTASHGGMWVSPERRAQMPPPLRLGRKAWYEEDCETALVAVAFARELDLNADARVAARKLIVTYFPDQWGRFCRAELPLILEAVLRSPKLGLLGGSAESKRKDARTWARQHSDSHDLARAIHGWNCWQHWQHLSVGSAIKDCDGEAHIDALAGVIDRLVSGKTALPVMPD